MEEKCAQISELCNEIIGPLEYNHKIWKKHKPKFWFCSSMEEEIKDIHELQKNCEQRLARKVPFARNIQVRMLYGEHLIHKRCPRQKYPDDWSVTVNRVVNAYNTLDDLLQAINNR